MHSHYIRSPIGDVPAILSNARNKGVRIWVDNGQLRYKGPIGALTPAELEALKNSKAEVIRMLGGADVPEGRDIRPASLRRLNLAPLTFSQRSYWDLLELGRRSSVRQIVSATRLVGKLDVDALREAVKAIVSRHDALRTRIVVHDEVPFQEVATAEDCELFIENLTALADNARKGEVQRMIDLAVLEPVNVSIGPLCIFRLLKLRSDEHVLIAALEHIISDAFSMNILLREMLIAYAQCADGRAIELPKIHIQFADYAIWQTSAQQSWVATHEGYWRKRLTGYQSLKFPKDHSLGEEKQLGWGHVPLRIGKKSKEELREWCRQKRTTLVMSAFVAYVALVMRWCNVSDTVIQYQSDGRANPKLENTIGYFASVLYLRIRLFGEERFLDLLNRVTEEYCQSYEHTDLSRMAAQALRPEFVFDSMFNWVPLGFGHDVAGRGKSYSSLASLPIIFENPAERSFRFERDPVVLLFDEPDEIVGGVYFPLGKFSTRTIDRFRRNYLMFFHVLLTDPERRLSELVLF